MTIERSRLAWRCRRGMLELDLLLQGFLDRGYEEMTSAQQNRFIQLLELSDQQLLDYLMRRAVPLEQEEVELIRLIHRANQP